MAIVRPGIRLLVRHSLVALATAATVGCSRGQPDTQSAPANYLFVWAAPPDT